LHNHHKSYEFNSKVVSFVFAGVLILAGSVVFTKDGHSQSFADPELASAEYGKRLIRETRSLLGPDQADQSKQYSGNRLDCSSCHLDSGSATGALSLLQTATRYPRPSGRDGGVRDLKDRINGCMQRSMNGRPFARDSLELAAMENYILSLNVQFSAMSDIEKEVHDPADFVEPARSASVEAGQSVYETRCLICHQENGGGLQKTADIKDGYVFPPLWGDDSYNNGAGMNRVLTAARFIKAKMPFGAPTLTDDEAYDVSAYINSKPRPQKADLELDFPDLTQKPVDSPYPPYADPFSQEQHRLGPFAPIREFYESLSKDESSP
tara:strand:- start:47468 stop:48436 length:969 start_codon:yes stop_codon:yes gene_type:complete